MEYQVIENVKKKENTTKNKNTCGVSVCAFIQVQSACKFASVWQMIKAATVCKWFCVIGFDSSDLKMTCDVTTKLFLTS